MSFSDALRSIQTYKRVFPDRSYNVIKSVFLIFIARHFSFAVVNRKNEVIGFEFFRFSRKDIKNGTIHESFIGVVSSESGKGVASKLREFSSQMFENNGLKPSTYNLDLRAYYNFVFAKRFMIAAHINVYNLFDFRNELTVYNDTGRSTYSLVPTYTPQYSSPYYNSLDQYLVRPDYYSPPRQIKLGVSVSLK